jgi:hypothetical protein
LLPAPLAHSAGGDPQEQLAEGWSPEHGLPAGQVVGLPFEMHPSAPIEQVSRVWASLQ